MGYDAASGLCRPLGNTCPNVQYSNAQCVSSADKAEYIRSTMEIRRSRLCDFFLALLFYSDHLLYKIMCCTNKTYQQQQAYFPCLQTFKTMESETGITAMTVREILDLCKTDSADLDSMRRSYLQQAGSVQFPDQLNDHLYWSYKVLHSSDISPNSVQFSFNFASIFHSFILL